jgi:hypothetical protein
MTTVKPSVDCLVAAASVPAGLVSMISGSLKTELEKHVLPVVGRDEG